MACRFNSIGLSKHYRATRSIRWRGTYGRSRGVKRGAKVKYYELIGTILDQRRSRYISGREIRSNRDSAYFVTWGDVITKSICSPAKQEEVWLALSEVMEEEV